MNTKYAQLLSHSKSKSSTSDAEDEEAHASLLGRPQKTTHQRPAMSFIIVISTLNILLFACSSFFWAAWFYDTHILLNGQYRRVSSYSPIFDRLELKSEIKVVNGTFWEPLSPSIARQRNDEADQLWAEFEIQRVIPVTAAEIRAIGADPSTVVKLEDEDWGLGDDAYVASLDVFHQLHCLDTLRQIAYPERYPETSRLRETVPWSAHIDHCIDIIFQELRCSGNLGLNTWHWVENHERPFPVFSIDKKCVDFEAVTRWRFENTIDMEKYFRIMYKPPGVKQLPAADDFYKYEQPNITNPNHLNGANSDVHFIL